MKDNQDPSPLDPSLDAAVKRWYKWLQTDKGKTWYQWWCQSQRREKMELKNYAITARVILQENDEANGTVAIEGFLTFSVMAEDFEKATVAAEELLPMDEFSLTGVEEILA